MSNRFIQNSVVFLLLQLSSIALSKDQTIEVVNSSNATLTLEHGVPVYSKAFIALKKIDPLQYQLNRAILNDSPEEIRDAVNAGANIHQPKIGKAPLLIAVLLKRANAVEALLKCGATVETEHDLDETLARYAAKLGDFKSACILLKKILSGKDPCYLPHKRGRFIWLLQESIAQRDPKSTVYLLRQSSSFFGKDEWKSASKKEWILKDAIAMDDIFKLLDYVHGKEDLPVELILPIIQELIDHGYEVDTIWNDKGKHGNIQHILYRYADIVELFIKNGANPNYKIALPRHPNQEQQFTYPIFHALNAGNKTVTEVLIDSGAYLDQTTSAHKCSQCCHGEKTPLAMAVNHGLADIVELLVAHDAKL